MPECFICHERYAPGDACVEEPLKGVEMSLAEYLANPQHATEESERAGYVLVKDEAGRTRLVVSSNRATERLPNEPQPHTCPPSWIVYQHSKKEVWNVNQVREIADMVYARDAEQAVAKWAPRHDARAQLIARGHPIVVCVQRILVPPGMPWRLHYQPHGPIETFKACGEYLPRFWAERVT